MAKKKLILKKILCGAFCVALAFSAFGTAGCKDAVDGITVYMPSGAPALALAKLMHEDTASDGVTYQVVNPSTIVSYVTYEDSSKNADLCVMPSNVASAKLGDGTRYQMLGAVTRGNLFFVAKNGTPALQSVADLQGKTVGVLSNQINNVPGLTFKAVLKKAGLEQGVTIKGITDITGDCDYYLYAEPMVSEKTASGEYTVVGDLQAFYKDAFGTTMDGYPQAVLVAKKSLIAEKTDWVEAFLKQVEESAEWILQADGETLVNAVSSHLADKNAQSGLKADILTENTISRCGIRFSYALDCKAETTAFLGEIGAPMPSDAFFYAGK